MNPPIELNTDGSCLSAPGKPGPGAGGASYVIRYYKSVEGSTDMPEAKEVEGAQGYRLSTNNRMEVTGMIMGINKVIDMIAAGDIKDTYTINAKTDSQYFCDAINKKWIDGWVAKNWMTSGFGGKAPTPVKNRDLWEQVLQIRAKLAAMSIHLNIEHVRGHNGDPDNERCDKLAKDAAESAKNGTGLVDEAYEATRR